MPVVQDRLARYGVDADNRRDPEIEAILARSDRDALFDDWRKVAGDLNAVGADMNADLSWITDEVEKGRERGASVEEMLATVSRLWSEKIVANATGAST